MSNNNNTIKERNPSPRKLSLSSNKSNSDLISPRGTTTTSKTTSQITCSKCTLLPYCSYKDEQTGNVIFSCAYHAPVHINTHVLDTVTPEQTRMYTSTAQVAWGQILDMLSEEMYRREELEEANNRKRLNDSGSSGSSNNNNNSRLQESFEDNHEQPRKKKIKEIMRYWNITGENNHNTTTSNVATTTTTSTSTSSQNATGTNNTPSSNTADIGYICPQCRSSHVDFVLVRGPGGSSSKDETWSSDRAESITRFTCKSCGHSWFTEN
jgi:hypothetical protein